MAYFAVNKNETEVACEYMLYRSGEEWTDEENPSGFDPYYVDTTIRLRKGSIEKLTGKKLTWKDNPIEYKEDEDDYNEPTQDASEINTHEHIDKNAKYLFYYFINDGNAIIEEYTASMPTLLKALQKHNIRFEDFVNEPIVCEHKSKTCIKEVRLSVKENDNTKIYVVVAVIDDEQEFTAIIESVYFAGSGDTIIVTGKDKNDLVDKIIETYWFLYENNKEKIAEQSDKFFNDHMVTIKGIGFMDEIRVLPKSFKDFKCNDNINYIIYIDRFNGLRKK